MLKNANFKEATPLLDYIKLVVSSTQESRGYKRMLTDNTWVVDAARVYSVFAVKSISSACLLCAVLAGCTPREYDYCETSMVKKYDNTTYYGSSYNEAFERSFRNRMNYDLQFKAKEFTKIHINDPAAMRLAGDDWINDVYREIVPCYPVLANDVYNSWKLVFEDEVIRVEKSHFESLRDSAVASLGRWRRENHDSLYVAARRQYSPHQDERKAAKEEISELLEQYREIANGTAKIGGIEVRFFKVSDVQAEEYELIDGIAVEGLVAWISFQNDELAAAKALLTDSLSSDQQDLLGSHRLSVMRLAAERYLESIE